MGGVLGYSRLGGPRFAGLLEAGWLFRLLELVLLAVFVRGAAVVLDKRAA